MAPDSHGRSDARAAAGALGQLADPRASAGELSDGLPVLLFPLRLETRFGGGSPPSELWVRVFPDDCLVDDFEEQLSDAEIDAGSATGAAAGAPAATRIASAQPGARLSRRRARAAPRGSPRS